MLAIITIFYIAPSCLVLLNMIRTKSISLRYVSSLRRLPKIITLDEWLTVYGYLGIDLETRNEPPTTKPGRPWRLMWSGVACAVSLLLYQFTLPLNIPLSLAQGAWNVFPVIQAAVAGVVLASSLTLAFYRPRRWRLNENHTAEYPYLTWGALNRTKREAT